MKKSKQENHATHKTGECKRKVVEKRTLPHTKGFTEKLKLTIELVPQSSWGKNVWGKGNPQIWDVIRKQTYKKYNDKCAICGAEGKLNCHEIWEYDDERHIQSLHGYVALCPLCHHVKHFRLANVLARKGKLDIEQVIKHFMNVNNCSREFFEDYQKHVYKVWKERSIHKWDVELNGYDKPENAAQPSLLSKTGKR